MKCASPLRVVIIIIVLALLAALLGVFQPARVSAASAAFDPPVRDGR